MAPYGSHCSLSTLHDGRSVTVAVFDSYFGADSSFHHARLGIGRVVSPYHERFFDARSSMNTLLHLHFRLEGLSPPDKPSFSWRTSR